MQRLGHTSSRFCRPVYSSTRRIIAKFHDGTPAKAVMFSPTHSRQIASTLRSKSGMSAVAIRGARNQPLQNVVSCISMADRSPTRLRPSRLHDPPSVSVLPSKTPVFGLLPEKTVATSRMPSVWFHQSDSSVTGMYLLRSDVVPDERAKSFTRPGEATFFSPASIFSI